jgi:adenylylsulfate kinase
MYDDARAWARENIENYKEIYVKATWNTLYRRDQKGLYTSGTKNVVGVDLPYDEPKHPDIVIENDGQESPEQIVEQLEIALGMKKNVVLYPDTGRAVRGAHVYAG